MTPTQAQTLKTGEVVDYKEPRRDACPAVVVSVQKNGVHVEFERNGKAVAWTVSPKHVERRA